MIGERLTAFAVKFVVVKHRRAAFCCDRLNHVAIVEVAYLVAWRRTRTCHIGLALGHRDKVEKN